jgi:hypothetical protein
VVIWYVFSVGCLVVGVHWLAGALEETVPALATWTTTRGSSRWWALRVVPVVACLVPIGATLGRGQVNLLLLALLCGMAGASLRGKRGQAGLWLAAAICLKVFPAYLLIYPLWRRDGRWLAGCAAGLVVGLGVIPAVVFGPSQTWAYYREWTNVLVRPGLGHGEDRTRDMELLAATTGSHSQSFLSVLHNTLHLDRAARPRQPAPETRLAHWGIGGVLTGLTLLALGWRRQPGQRELLGLGALLLMMFLLSPVCHPHYFCLALPITAGFLAVAWESAPRKSAETTWGHPWLVLLFGVNGLACALPYLPGLELLRDLGIATYGTLLLWLVAMLVLRRNPHVNREQKLPREYAQAETLYRIAA